MGTFSDKAQAVDTIKAELDKSASVTYPCLKCGKATKPHHGPDERICSNKLCEDRKAMKVVLASQMTAVTILGDGPKYPCPKCGRESKADHQPGSRICSAPACRNRFTL